MAAVGATGSMNDQSSGGRGFLLFSLPGHFVIFARCRSRRDIPCTTKFSENGVRGQSEYMVFVFVLRINRCDLA